MTAKVTINGMTITSARSISVVNGKVLVNGDNVDTGESKTISIVVEGNLDSINADACSTITVAGSAGSIKTMSGNVKAGDVAGSVTTMSGDIRCGAVGGSVSSMSGDITKGA